MATDQIKAVGGRSWTVQDAERLRRRIVDEHARGLCAVADGDEVLAVVDAYDRVRVENEQLLDALRAVLEALDVPHAATIGGEETRCRVLGRRTVHAVIALRALAEPNARMDWEIADLRERLAEHPPTGYVTQEQAQAALAEGKTWAEAVTPAKPSA
ncbi:hypothetical protein [Nonomuraea sp. NPDC049158]|uniref:hypothetical protein n=1 Tax=Nonomuraea sp. NPDC049158 TaxID=3155649 RepID=UPI0033CF6DA5